MQRLLRPLQIGIVLALTTTSAWVQPARPQAHAESAPTQWPPPLFAAISLPKPVVTVAPDTPPPVQETLEQWAFRLTQEDEYDELILVTTTTWQLDPFLFKGLLYTESRLDPGIINKISGAAGIAQFTAGGRRGVTNLRRMRGVPPSRATFTRAQALVPSEAIPAAAELLVYLNNTCKHTAGALMAYNSGSCRGSRGFVLTVIKHTNRFRTAAGLPPMPVPSMPSRKSRKPFPNV